MDNPRARSVRQAGRPAVVAVLTLALAWAYLPSLRLMADRWASDPRYSHGYFVPFFALGFLWVRRDERPTLSESSGATWCGLGLVAGAALVHFMGVYYYLPWIESAALVPSLAGLALIFGGVEGLRWAAPAIGFLLFMVPLPYRVEGWLAGPLQGSATRCSTFVLQTMGLPAFAEGNIITINTSKIGVVEACNGLGMLVTFTAISTGLALLVRRPVVEMALIVLSSGPIALLANVARITATGLLREFGSGRIADAVYHDLAGWLMMPVAFALLAIELRLLGRVFIAPARTS